jgi:hypothetical protein
MNRILISTMLLIITFRPLFAASEGLANGPSIGFQIGQFHRDFGIGFQVSAINLWGTHPNLRLRTNISFFEHVVNEEMVLSPYTIISLGLVGMGGNVTEKIRLYGEGGGSLLILPDNLSTQRIKYAPMGIFGFEFFLNDTFNYFLEAGISLGQVRADKLVGKPFIANGMLLQVGFRVHLKNQ